MRLNRNHISFVLVEPRTPGNIGAAARALKTMGFRNLLLVNPCDYREGEARWMAHASEDILDRAVVYQSLEDAVADMHFVVATTQRTRSFHLPFFTPKELANRIIEISADNKIALVFGREKTGLTNGELRLCDSVSTIPSHTSHPSLNLAQAVMLYASEFFQAAYEDTKAYPWRLASHGDLQRLYQHLQNSLERVGFVPRDNWENFILRVSRMFGRATPEVRDVKVWHKIIKSYDQYIDRLEEKKRPEQD